MASKSNIYAANRQWATRPDDQRFLSMHDLVKAVGARRSHCEEINCSIDDLGVEIGDDLRLTHKGHGFDMTHWASTQIGLKTGVPMAFLRTLPPRLAAANLLYGLKSCTDMDLQLLAHNGQEVRAVTSQKYGRIWDIDIVMRISDMVDATGGRWQVPAASYQSEDPLRATTLYASDEDIFIFLVDPTNPIEIPGQDKPSFRGFFAWNSEVGSSVFGLTTFLYEYVCDNRIVWGASNVGEIRIVHNTVGPDRFLEQVAPQLLTYASSSDSIELSPIVAAQRTRLVDLASGFEDGDVIAWVSDKTSIPPATVKAAFDRTVEVDHEPTDTVWDATQSLTAFARGIPNSNVRTKFERKASNLLTLIAA